MTLNVSALTTRDTPLPSLSALQRPEVKCSRVTGAEAEEENWIVIQIRYFKLNIGAELSLTESLQLSSLYVYIITGNLDPLNVRE